MSSPFVPPRNVTKCLVERVETPDGAPAVRKSPRGGPFGRWISGLLLRRETHFLERLQHLPCVPRVIESGPDGLLVEFIEGSSLSDVRREGIPRETARKVNELPA